MELAIHEASGNRRSTATPSRRRQFLLAALAALGSGAVRSQPGPLDGVPVYLVPLDDFPEDLAGTLARALQEGLGFRVKASLRLPPLRLPVLPGTNQLIAEEILQQGAAASARLPEATLTTYRLFLTTRDINGRSGNFRFQFSTHNRVLNSSVLSLARLLDYERERPVFNERAVSRLLKMSKRAIGEMVLGWKRSPDPADLMYAPIMGLADLDRLGLEHRQESAPSPPAEPVGGQNRI